MLVYTVGADMAVEHTNRQKVHVSHELNLNVAVGWRNSSLAAISPDRVDTHLHFYMVSVRFWCGIAKSLQISYKTPNIDIFGVGNSSKASELLPFCGRIWSN